MFDIVFPGKEVIVQYSTSIDSDGKFYTDSNGRQMMLRERFESGFDFGFVRNLSFGRFLVRIFFQTILVVNVYN